MAFSDFRYPDVLTTFGLEETATDLSTTVPPVPLGPSASWSTSSARSRRGESVSKPFDASSWDDLLDTP